MAQQKKILLVDDDEGILDALKMMLEFGGHDVTVLQDGDLVLGSVDPLPDLLILDTWMSGVDGRNICSALKKDPATAPLPILMISASHEIKNSAYEAGANRFMAKPFEMDSFLEVVDEMVQKDQG